jgi:hypothetical protein
MNILQRYPEWSHHQTTIINALICSLYQGSGTGKSKIAVEAIKSGLGFYIVLRPDTNPANPLTGYPYKELVTFKRKLAWIAMAKILYSFSFLSILEEADELNNRINPSASVMSEF